MSLLSLVRSGWRRFLGKKGVRPAPIRRPSAIRRVPLELEHLEGRTVPSTMSIGMNLERIQDFSAAWMFTDVFKSSRLWMSGLYNTATRTMSQDTTGLLPVSVDALGWPTRLNQTINAQG